MDKIALISDIHGNIPALEAVLSSIRSRGTNRIICLGDLVGKGPEPDKAVDIIRESCQLVILGNWDYLICKPFKNESFAWNRQLLGSDRLKYLGSLPKYHEFLLSGKLVRLSHAHPEDVFNRIFHYDSVDKKMAMFSKVDGGEVPSIVGYGDIHTAYIQNFKDKTIFNTASVGNSLDINQASYVQLSGNLSEASGEISIEFVRIPYDIERSISIAKKVNMPEWEEYAEELRTCKYRGIKKLI
jgi:protein phosphatase